jgi:hypothetical protein
MLKLNFSQMSAVRIGCWLGLVAILALPTSAALAQSTVATGSIVGTVTDATNAVVSGAMVTITGPTGQSITVTTTGDGIYSSGFLVPGVYTVRVAAKGSKTAQLALAVRVNDTTMGSVKLQAGAETAVVEMHASDVQVNTEQPSVQGVLSASQIEDFLLNGRNFLDLAQLEPGVQIEDAQSVDPAKAGYFSLSIGGRFGRTTRTELDGADISDETFGTTTMGVPAGSVQEFQVAQASLDMSTQLTTAGAVNVATKSGTNSIHGEAFGQFRDNSIASASLPGGGNPPFQRSQYGADVGGALIKDKLFVFGDGERTKQDDRAPVPIAAPFQAYSGSFSNPFRENNLTGRLDYELNKSARLFYRFSYFKDLLDANSGYGYSVYSNQNIARDHTLGLDFNRGSFTHSIRFSYLKFQNQMVDATTGNSALPFNDLGAEIFMGATGLIAGPNLSAPQSTAQSDREIRYDGSRVWRAHIVRFGATFNYIQGAVFVPKYKNGPSITSQVTPAEIAAAVSGPFPGGASNPFNYPADGGYVLGNGLGYSTAKPALGSPAGGLGPDNRLLLYLGDSWKMKPNFTLTYGLRYERDTARTDSQYGPLPGLNGLVAGLGNRVHQPDQNFAPHLGFAWDPAMKGKISFRGGIGLFYENVIWNNLLFDAPYRETKGAFLQAPNPCAAAGIPAPIQTATGTITTGSEICGTTTGYPLIGNALPALLALQSQYQAASLFDLQGSNSAYAEQYLTDCAGGSNCFFAPGNSMLNPNYRSPRSVVMNIGFQREIRTGMMVSVDFVRNVQTHYLLGVDQNHAGDTSTFNLFAAQQAIQTTLADCGVASIVQSYSINCSFDPANGTDDNGTWNTPANPARHATIADYAAHGLGSSADMGGASCLAALGYSCAFPGKNPNAPPLGFLSPVGRSVYRGVQMKWVENVKNPFPGAQAANFRIAYALSRFKNSGGGVAADSPVTAASSDQDFIAPALDNNNVNHYFGPSTLDRTHQVSIGGYVDVQHGFQVGIMAHLYSPLSTTLTVPHTGLGPGEIFRTDFTGDGTTQDPIPGTKVGSFDRGIDITSLNNVISKYNTTVAGQPTPAGRVLLNDALMTQVDLVGLGAVAPILAAAPGDRVNYPWLKTLDASVSWSHTFFDRVTIRPSVAFFNLPNVANFDLPPNMMSGLLTGGAGTVNGTGRASHGVNRVGAGTGVFALGSPRQAEFSLKISF